MATKRVTKCANSIRIDTGIKRIEVNDAGDYITLNFSDQSFLPRFMEMAKEIQGMGDEISAKIDQIETTDDVEKSLQQAQINADACKRVADQIDQIFGENTCMKVFATDCPAIDLVTDFIAALLPYFTDYVDSRQKKLNAKYSPQRKGNA